jgi:hypothetical protein
MSKGGALLKNRFKERFGSDTCRMIRSIDRSVQAEYDLPGPMTHLMRLKTGDQVLHAIRTAKDDHWIPTHKELEILCNYLSLIRRLCDDKWYPDIRKMGKICKLGRKSRMTRLLKTIYGNRLAELMV